MAAASSEERELSCSICLELFNLPVGLPCGHTFCKACVERHFAAQSEVGFTCPECREVFYRKPRLNKNVFIANVVHKFKEANVGRRCDRHGHGLDLYCRTDARLMCVECTDAHEKHDIVSVRKERAHKWAAAEQIKERLSGSYDELLRLISEDKESALRAVDKERDLKLLGICREIENSRTTLGGLTEALGRIRSLEETEDPVEFLEGYTLQWESFVNLASEPMEETPSSASLDFEMPTPLQEQIDELLSAFRTFRGEDPTSADQPKPKTPEGNTAQVQRRSPPVSLREMAAPHEVQAAGASAQPTASLHGLSRADIIMRIGCSPTLDINSAHDRLLISSDARMMTVTHDSQGRLDHPNRFDHFTQALCCQSFSGGEHYWEVDVGGARWCRVGVAYGTIPRKGKDPACFLGMGDASWCLEKHCHYFSVSHGGVEATLLMMEPPGRIGVHLHWDGGLLAFYRTDTMELLYATHQPFTHPLYPVLGVWGLSESVRILTPHDSA
ncbi:E3 ubiquitin-protein ligase RNF135-like isoform X2 [Lethenteron reissneri]|uniref:E3 ubiquitin-protein ligase RNF135-like isoform X2 n=1 Tax=Lethenteron reissneri TaxID=7753 RepID=UPI002AB6390C|nr:E3 ubiquitin-protein ligase RNF135-like isoform X2 [Lethenteron reissneri]